MNTNCILASILIFALVLTNCKKYDEGPCLSFRSKKDRVVGKWQTDRWFVNKVEQASAMLYDQKHEFTKDGKYLWSGTNPYTGVSSGSEGTWEFRSRKEQLVLGLPDEFDGQMQYQVWDILKLKNNELWLEKIDGNIYEWRLKPQ